MPKKIDLSGKIALITGASRGIGAAVAKGYAKAGAHVILLARSVGGLEEIDDAIREAGGKATLMPLDLLELNELDKLGPTLMERFGGLDIFVGNAGMLGTLGPIAHGDPKEFQKVMDTNLTANFRLLRTLDPLLRASDAGRVIFVTSGMAQKCTSYWGAYSISKAALEALVKTYAAETVKTNVKVNLLRPGMVDTAMLAGAYPGGPPRLAKKPEDIVRPFLELAAPDCKDHGSYIDLYQAA